MANFDFVAAWKAIAIVITGVFGLIAALTESRNKETGKLTMWGKIAIIGLLTSTVGGAFAQISENQHAVLAAKAEVARTRAVLDRLDRTATEVRHNLLPLGKTPTVEISLVGNCSAPDLARFCAQLPEWSDWLPIGATPHLPASVEPQLRAIISFALPGVPKGNFGFANDVTQYELDSENKCDTCSYAIHRAKNMLILVLSGPVMQHYTSGDITGLYDLSEKQFLVIFSSQKLKSFRPNFFSVDAPTGQRVTLLDKALSMYKMPASPGMAGFQGTYPKDVAPD